MSEYQCYEFLAVDRPLDDRPQGEVRMLSTRARISTPSFVNEHHWGNLRDTPNRMMAPPKSALTPGTSSE